MSTIVWLWLGANLVAAVFAAAAIVNMRAFTLVPPATAEEAVDAIVAMRDESANAQAFLDDALRSPNIARVIVADDGSCDRTREIVEAHAARDERVVLVDASAGGKTQALAQAFARTAPHAPWLLFLDADVRVDASAPAALIAFAHRRGAAAATAWPRLEIASVGGALLGPLVTQVLLQFLPLGLAAGDDPRAAAGNGQCFLVRSDAYERCGGHAGVSEIVEDVALARALKRAGFGVALGSAAAIASVRSYDSLSEAIRGHARSLYFGAGPLGCVAIAAWSVLFLISPLPLYAVRIAASRRMREPALCVLLAPAAAALGAIAACYALCAGSRGRLRWRGRFLRG